MLEDFLKWFHPEHADAGRKLITHLLGRIEALEAAKPAEPVKTTKPAEPVKTTKPAEPK